jgi:hypothetical protein
MAVRNDFTAGEVLAAADLNDTFGAKLDLAGGKILQIVRATDSTNRSTTSTSFVDVTGMSVTITPQKNDSAIIVLGSFRCIHDPDIGATRGVYQITDASNNPVSGAEAMGISVQAIAHEQNVTLIGYSTPATTGPVSYKLRFNVRSSGITATITNASNTGQMYAIEVSA